MRRPHLLVLMTDHTHAAALAPGGPREA